MGPISLHTKFEPNLCMHTRAMAVFVCARPFKLLSSALIKLPSKQKVSYTSYLHFIEKAHQDPSIHSGAAAASKQIVIKKCGHKKKC